MQQLEAYDSHRGCAYNGCFAKNEQNEGAGHASDLPVAR
jgi:hypothetical protein